MIYDGCLRSIGCDVRLLLADKPNGRRAEDIGAETAAA